MKNIVLIVPFWGRIKVAKFKSSETGHMKQSCELGAVIFAPEAAKVFEQSQRL